MRSINRRYAVLCATLVVSCSSSSPPPAPPHATGSCSDLACIEANEGKVIDLAGTFMFPADPKRKGKHLYRLLLADGTSVVLHARHEQLTADRDRQQLTVRGIVYTKVIPDRYGIIQRTSDPYCVELLTVF